MVRVKGSVEAEKEVRCMPTKGNMLKCFHEILVNTEEDNKAMIAQNEMAYILIYSSHKFIHNMNPAF